MIFMLRLSQLNYHPTDADKATWGWLGYFQKAYRDQILHWPEHNRKLAMKFIDEFKAQHPKECDTYQRRYRLGR